MSCVLCEVYAYIHVYIIMRIPMHDIDHTYVQCRRWILRTVLRLRLSLKSLHVCMLCVLCDVYAYIHVCTYLCVFLCMTCMHMHAIHACNADGGFLERFSDCVSAWSCVCYVPYVKYIHKVNYHACLHAVYAQEACMIYMFACSMQYMHMYTYAYGFRQRLSWGTRACYVPDVLYLMCMYIYIC